MTVRSGVREADAQPAPQARRGAGLRRDRPAGRRVVQPALDRPPARRGHARAAARQAAPAQPVLGARTTSCSANGNAPVHTLGRVPVHPATEGITPDRLRALVERGAAARARGGRAAARRACASRRGCRSAPAALDARALPGQRGRRAGGAPPARVRGAVPAPARGGGRGGARGARARKARPLAARGVVVDRWRWSLPFELTGDQASAHRRRSTRTSPASGRCSGC